ncbi:hypothetical protein HD806DRAFT_543402 [Xylariaceae sp. AK1471]|nr:hypothetical protein HD806DRAFT_543402 [Xylariaceae sp. AK1471]
MNSASQLCPLHGSYWENIESQTLHSPLEDVHFKIMNAPFDSYVGRTLQGHQDKYHIKPSCWDDGDLVVYPAVSHNGELCEAQFFKKCQLPTKLYLSRKRRIQRLKRSKNLMDELDHGDVRIFVSRVSEGIARTRNCWKCLLMNRGAGMQYNFSIKDFPRLCSAAGKYTPRDLENVETVRAHSSFAEVASLRLAKNMKLSWPVAAFDLKRDKVKALNGYIYTDTSYCVGYCLSTPLSSTGASGIEYYAASPGLKFNNSLELHHLLLK